MVKIYSIAPGDSQMSLLDVPKEICSDCSAGNRNLFGTFAQDWICSALNLTPIPINGKYAICPDAESDTHYYEIKSVRKSGGKIVIYKWRIEKEKTLGESLYYAIFVHDFRNLNSYSELRICAQGSFSPEIILISAADIHDLCAIEKLNVPNKRPGGDRIGYNRSGYSDGYYNLSISPIRKKSIHLGTIKFDFGGHQYSTKLFTWKT